MTIETEQKDKEQKRKPQRRSYKRGEENKTENKKARSNNKKENIKFEFKKENYTYIDLSKIFDNNPTYINKINSNYLPNVKGYQKISQIIVENLKNT